MGILLQKKIHSARLPRLWNQLKKPWKMMSLKVTRLMTPRTAQNRCRMIFQVTCSLKWYLVDHCEKWFRLLRIRNYIWGWVTILRVLYVIYRMDSMCKQSFMSWNHDCIISQAILAPEWLNKLIVFLLRARGTFSFFLSILNMYLKLIFSLLTLGKDHLW